MGKLWSTTQLRLTEEMMRSIRELAERDHRSIQHECRWLLMVGIRHEVVGNVNVNRVVVGMACGGEIGAKPSVLKVSA
jgi:hypothetical protein